MSYRGKHPNSHVIQYLSCFVGMTKTSDAKRGILKHIMEHSRKGNSLCKTVDELQTSGKDVDELL